jgi:hypothetical protein
MLIVVRIVTSLLSLSEILGGFSPKLLENFFLFVVLPALDTGPNNDITALASCFWPISSASDEKGGFVG